MAQGLDVFFVMPTIQFSSCAHCTLKVRNGQPANRITRQKQALQLWTGGCYRELDVSGHLIIAMRKIKLGPRASRTKSGICWI